MVKYKKTVVPFSQYGDGFFQSVWNGIKKGANFTKKHKLISTALGLSKDPRAQVASVVARSLGFGLAPVGGSMKVKRGRGLTLAGGACCPAKRKCAKKKPAKRKPAKRKYTKRKPAKGRGLKLAGGAKKSRATRKNHVKVKKSFP